MGGVRIDDGIVRIAVRVCCQVVRLRLLLRAGHLALMGRFPTNAFPLASISALRVSGNTEHALKNFFVKMEHYRTGTQMRWTVSKYVGKRANSAHFSRRAISIHSLLYESLTRVFSLGLRNKASKIN